MKRLLILTSVIVAMSTAGCCCLNRCHNQCDPCCDPCDPCAGGAIAPPAAATVPVLPGPAVQAVPAIPAG